MFLIALAFLCALSISGVAIYYSVLGLAAIFAAAKVPIYIMGGVLEVAKLVTASWLYQNWKNIPFLLKTYLTTAVAILMIITSLGIFGFLSKAHIEQATPAADITAKISNYDERILREENKIVNLTAKIQRIEDGSGNADELIAREQSIIDTANEKIASSVALIQKKIDNVKEQIKDIQNDADKKITIIREDSKTQISTLREDSNKIIESEQIKLSLLDQAVSDVLNSNKSFFNEEKAAKDLKDSQKPERDAINKKINNAQSNITTGIAQINTDTDNKIKDVQTTADQQIDP